MTAVTRLRCLRSTRLAIASALVAGLLSHGGRALADDPPVKPDPTPPKQPDSAPAEGATVKDPQSAAPGTASDTPGKAPDSGAKPADGDKKDDAKPADGDKKDDAKPADGDKKDDAKPADGDKKGDAKPDKKDEKKDDKKVERELKKIPKRELPDYSGRGKPPTTAGDVALTTLRVAVSPLYFVSEYIVRRPLEVAIPAAERSDVPKTLYDFFLFGPDHKIGVVPTFLADFGLRPSVGLYAFWNDAGVTGHDVIVHGSTWGEHWLAGGVTDRYRFKKGSTDNEALTVDAIARPDHPFYGIGPRSLQKSESRYGGTRIDAFESLDKHVTPHVVMHAQGGIRAEDFHDGDNIGNDPTIAQAIANGTFAPPPGYSQNYTLFESSLRFAFDTRTTKSTTNTGVRLEVGGEHDASLRDGARSGWVKYGGALTGAIDLDGHHRTLSLSMLALFVDPMRHDIVVPFTELVSLGGFNPMRAYLAGRMIDRSAAVATLEYRWPVWNALDGTIKAEVGNVFDEHLNDFAMNLLRFSGSIGLETTGATDNPLQLVFGVGSETFEQGGTIDSFRLFVGTTTNGL